MACSVQCVTTLMHYKIHDNFGVPYRLPWQRSEFPWYFHGIFLKKNAEKKNSHHVASHGGEGCPILGENYLAALSVCTVFPQNISHTFLQLASRAKKGVRLTIERDILHNVDILNYGSNLKTEVRLGGNTVHELTEFGRCTCIH